MRAMNPMNLLPAFRTAVPFSIDSTGLPNSPSSHEAEDVKRAKDERNGDVANIKKEASDIDEQAHSTDHRSHDELSDTQDTIDEKSPLLREVNLIDGPRPKTPLVKRVGSAVLGSCRVIVAALLAPGRYIIACFYDDNGHFSAFLPFVSMGRMLTPKKRARGARQQGAQAMSGPTKRKAERSPRGSLWSISDEKSPMTSDSEFDSQTSRALAADDDSPARNTRSKSSSASAGSSDGSMPKRSIRIKTVNQDELRRRKQKRAEDQSGSGTSKDPPLTVTNIKSPTSSVSFLALTKYPRAPAPPRPLVPRRQPSYSSAPAFSPNPQKTLVIDLDETLIHSMAKGGRMSTGHMVEVKLSSPVGAGSSVIAPQVPILYYVHKRPHCDEFLRKISKWYNLVVFTASVQEYADPVIDWLELERKYFSARYYRQHCTYRNGAYIKDLSQVEPDLSKVMILDNSPISYIFHEDNAIPIEGWISDPTDNDLLHLIPLLEGLQHTTDVRALLALRLGESVS